MLSASGLFATVESPASPEASQTLSNGLQQSPVHVMEEFPESNDTTQERGEPQSISEPVQWKHAETFNASPSTQCSHGSQHVEIDDAEHYSDISSRQSKSSLPLPPPQDSPIDSAYEARLRQELVALYADVSSEQQLVTALVQAEESIERDVIIERLRQVKLSPTSTVARLQEYHPQQPPDTPDSTTTPSTQQLLLGESSTRQPHDSMSRYSETSSLASSVHSILIF